MLRNRKAGNSDTKRYRIIARLLLLLMIVIVFCFSSQKGEVSYEISENVANALAIEGIRDNPASTKPLIGGLSLRKYAHILLFLLMGIAAYYSFEIKKHELHILHAWSICCTVAIMDELHQLYVPGRSFSVVDIIIDAIGAGVAIIMCAIIRKDIFCHHKAR